MIDYPYYTPIILTNTLFEDYGGDTHEYTNNQLSIAYWLAEKQMTEHLNTFLKPTLVTGTYDVYGWPLERVRLDTYYVRNVRAVTYHYPGWDCTVYNKDGESFVYEARLGYLMITDTTLGGCWCEGVGPGNVSVVYESGLSSGTAYQPDLLLALRMAADLNLHEMFDPFGLEGGAGDPGILEWSSMGHREVRKALGTSAFGDSPMANKIVKLVRGLAPRPALKLGG